MKPEAVRGAFLMAESVRKRAAELATVREFGEQQQAWHDGLMSVHSAFERLKSGAGRRGPSFEWYRTIIALREEDQLLSYLEHARHAEHHTFGSTLGPVGHQIFGPMEGVMTFKHREYFNGGRFVRTPVEFKSSGQNGPTFIPETVRPLPAPDSNSRGKKILRPPAVMHLGKMLPDVSAAGLLRSAALTITEIAHDAQSFVPPNTPIEFTPVAGR